MEEESKHQELQFLNNEINPTIQQHNTQTNEVNGQWICPKCQSFNNISHQKCIICNLNEATNENNKKYIMLETDSLEFTKCQSISEEISLIGSYIMVFATIILSIICVVIGTKHINFIAYLICSIICLLITIILFYIYNKYIPSLKLANTCSSMIIINGTDNEFVIYNSSETIILKCFHLERYGIKYSLQN
eukprot:221808_1